MEELGMERQPKRRPGLLTRALACALSLALPPAAGAQDEIITAFVEVPPEELRQNRPFTLTVLVNHPLPSEVTVRPPALGALFAVDLVRSGNRFVRSPTNEPLSAASTGERWTAVEFVLTPRQSGTLALGLFTVTITPSDAKDGEGEKENSSEGEGENQTRRFYIQGPPVVVLPAAGALPAVSLTWDKHAAMRAGESAEFVLRLASPPAPAALGCRYEPPPEALVEALPLSGSDLAAGVVLRLWVLPMTQPAGGILRLSAKPVTYQGRTLTPPPLTIQVRPSSAR